MSALALQFFSNVSGDMTKHLFSPEGNSSLASTRLQTIPALNALKELGHSINVASLHSTTPSLLQSIGSPSVCIVGKMNSTDTKLIDSMVMANLAAVARLKRQGTPIVILYNDNHICKREEPAFFYKDLLNFADYIVYPSDSLAQITAKNMPVHAPATVINDPWQFSNIHSFNKRKTSDTVKLIWFGSGLNTPYLKIELKNLLDNMGSIYKFELTILASQFTLDVISNFLKTQEKPTASWTFRFVRWSNTNQPNQLEAELDRAEFSIIPSNPNDPAKFGVSHNRLVDSIRGGCIPIASPMPSYLELSKLCLTGYDFSQLLAIGIEQYDRLCSKYSGLREASLERFSPSQNRAKWINFFKKVLD